MATQPQDPRSQTRTEPNRLEELYDLPLMLGGPTFQLSRKLHLGGDGLELMLRRIVVITAVAWLPLLLLVVLGTSKGSIGRASYLRDIEVHVRFLVALPVLVAAELIVHSRLRPTVQAFVQRRIVLPQDLPRFHNAIKSAIRLRDSIHLELVPLVLIYTFGLWLWLGWRDLSIPTWYFTPGRRWGMTPAGFWYVFVSIPIYQFLLLRWYLRLFIWFRFLWHVSRMNLNLIPTHPDRAAGLAFLGKSAYAFGPILFSQGAMLSALVASRVLSHGDSLLSFKPLVVGLVAFFVLVLLGPLVMFSSQMLRAKRKGLAEYGVLSQRYVESFDKKWVRDPAPTENLLGTSDIQSLADLSNSYGVLLQMRPVPFALADISRLAAVTAAPLLPLLLTTFSPEELIVRILKVVL